MRLARLSWIFYLAYVFALAFGVAGIGIALRRPELWAHLEAGRVVYAFGMQWGGVLYIVLGAAAMLSFALATLGSRRALSFFVLSTSISLGAELIGTSTGWPFGNYAYTSGLGPKILDRVPFTIPLSWFTVGLASWLLAAQIGARWFRTTRPEVTIPLGVWLLVVWDLVLDPAMAHEAMQARFWVWHQTGSYYGMPVINFVGWALTGFAFVTASRLAWRSDPPVPQSPLLPYAIYTANLLFAAALCATVNLWGPILIATVLGLLPATLVLVPSPDRLPSVNQPAPTGSSVSERSAWYTLRFLSRLTLARRRVTVEGWEHLPAIGPAILAPHHVHHLDDGRALLATLPQQIRFLVALDWVPSVRWRRVMEFLCRLAGWPVIVRPSEFGRPDLVYDLAEARRSLIRGLREAVDRVAAGQWLVVFPHAYPLVDPHLPGRRHGDSPLYGGALWIARRAASRRASPVPVIPVRLRYARDEIAISIQPPLVVDQTRPLATLLRQLERRLSPADSGLDTVLVRAAERIQE